MNLKRNDELIIITTVIIIIIIITTTVVSCIPELISHTLKTDSHMRKDYFYFINTSLTWCCVAPPAEHLYAVAPTSRC